MLMFALLAPTRPVALKLVATFNPLLFFESNENAFPTTTGMLSRRIHPLGFSGRSLIGVSGGRASWAEVAGLSLLFALLYCTTEHARQPQNGA